jgi:hypothetical protein
MASDSALPPLQQQPDEDWGPHRKDVSAPPKPKAGGGSTTGEPPSTTSSGDSGSGWRSFLAFLARYWWKLLLALIPLSVFLFWSWSDGIWPLYLLSEISSAAFGIFVVACWIRHDRAKANTATLGGKGGLDQLGFFNSRLAKRSPELFDIATKEVLHEGEVTRGKTDKEIAPARAMVANYWEKKSGTTSLGATASGAGSQSGNGKDEEMMKILQPEYAIGMGIITRDDYNNEMNEYFAQSELSLGLIVPLILIVLGLVLTPQVGLNGLPWVLLCVALAPISGLLFFIGMERWQKYRMELKLLILGNWEKMQEAKKQAKATAAAGTASKAVQDAIAKAIHGTAKSKEVEAAVAKAIEAAMAIKPKPSTQK